MREAAVPGYRLSKSKRSTRVLTTLGMVGLLIGLLMAALTTITKTGLGAEDVSTYYRGTGLAASETSELEDLSRASVGRPFNEMVDVTHLHLMGGSLMLFLLCHLLSLCQMKDSLRIKIYLISFVSFLATFLLPWGIVYIHPFFSYLFGPSVIIFMLSLVFMCLYPIKEMWFSKP